MELELSIVMPCLNEAETIELCVKKALSFLEKAGIAGEVIIADNGSTDGSQDIAHRHGARVVDVPVRGYGAAIFYGVMAAHGTYCVMGDADDSYDFSNLDPFVKELRAGADLVMGNRFRGGIAPGAMPWKNRYIGNPILSFIGRFLFKCPARDFHCGLRAFSKDAFLRMDLRTTGMEFASEMVIKATMQKMKIVEVPTTLSPDGRSRAPHLRPFRDGWRHLRFMLLFSPNWLFLYPGMAMMLAGITAGTLLYFRPMAIGNIHFSVGTLVYCTTLVQLGFQAILFMLLSRAFAIQEGLFPRPKRGLLDILSRFEYGVLFGAVFMLLGGILAARGVNMWLDTNFGRLDVERIARIVIFSSVFLSMGFEIILSSFLLGTFRLNVRAIAPERDITVPE